MARRNVEIAKKDADPRTQSIKGFHDRHANLTATDLFEQAVTMGHVSKRAARTARSRPIWKRRGKKVDQARAAQAQAVLYAVLGLRLAARDDRKPKDAPAKLSKLSFKEVAAAFDTVEGDKPVDRMGRAAGIEAAERHRTGKTRRRAA